MASGACLSVWLPGEEEERKKSLEREPRLVACELRVGASVGPLQQLIPAEYRIQAPRHQLPAPL